MGTGSLASPGQALCRGDSPLVLRHQGSLCKMSAMKTSAFVILVIILAVPLFAQDFQPLPAPSTVVGVPFYLDSSAGELKKLANEPYKERASGGPFMNSTLTRNVEMEGRTSAFRIPSHNKIVFVYDATTLPRLYKFTVKGARRDFPYEKGNLRNSTPIDGITVSVSRYKETAFQFSSEQPLEPGEYAIVFGDRIYTFGVDEKK